MFPTVEVPRLLAAFVMDRANIAPGSTGIIEGFEEDVEEPPDERFSLPPEADPDESDVPDEGMTEGAGRRYPGSTRHHQTGGIMS